MPITKVQQVAAEGKQTVAATNASKQVRLIAGPGTGKSRSIEHRVCWLLENGVSASEIAVVSFTRASARDLKSRIGFYCAQNVQPDGQLVRVSTLHSLALSILRKANLLTRYPTEPLVLDKWELKNFFNSEFGQASGIKSIDRQSEIQRYIEAFWSTDDWNHPNYIQPDPPVGQTERDAFLTFHRPRAQLYACVLPGEVVRACVTEIETQGLDPVELLGLRHLIVDEFQDLNPLDLKFVAELESRGMTLFVAGDDDQSIYAFRFASPHGIQEFARKYTTCGDHMLMDCFRCSTAVVETANALIQANPAPDRIKKTLQSLYSGAEPPLAGLVLRQSFKSESAEAKAIAESCQKLISRGIKPREILVLLSNNRLMQPFQVAFENAGVEFEPVKETSFLDEDAGRLIMALIRIACNADDYVAHRILLGTLPGVGIGTCNSIAQAVISNNRNYKEVYYAQQLPTGLFGTREGKAISKARQLCAQIQGWSEEDTLDNRRGVLLQILKELFGEEASNAFVQTLADLAPPDEIRLDELRDLLATDNDEQQEQILNEVYTRLALAPPEDLLPPKVRFMTMHGAKGLSAQVVFIPGLEDEYLPGSKKKAYPGLVLESARMLYVSITRARVACILSYCRGRRVYGKWQNQTPSRFTTDLNGRFEDGNALSDTQADGIVNMVSNI